MILVADAHVQAPAADGAELADGAEFMDMLAHLAHTRHDVIFMGDIFDLWIALPGYETPLQRQFLGWCRRQRRHRVVGYMEGNHEFFVHAAHREAFTWCSDAECHQDGRGQAFTHGDRINRSDRGYLRFRRLTKNPLTRALMRIMPGGPILAQDVKRRMHGGNPRFRKHLPKGAIAAYAARPGLAGVRHLFIGHFHLAFQQREAGRPAVHGLPPWSGTGQVTLFQPDPEMVRHLPWQDIPTA